MMDLYVDRSNRLVDLFNYTNNNKEFIERIKDYNYSVFNYVVSEINFFDGIKEGELMEYNAFLHEVAKVILETGDKKEVSKLEEEYSSKVDISLLNSVLDDYTRACVHIH